VRAAHDSLQQPEAGLTEIGDISSPLFRITLGE
jgi:hypothetical protein